MELDKLEAIMKLMKEYKINELKLDDIEIKKILHEYPVSEEKQPRGLPTTFDEIEGVTPWPKL